MKGYHESLKFANKSCEHLEQKLEESESELRELKLTNVKQEATLQVKMKIIEDLQSSLESLESENLQLQENLKLTSPNFSKDQDGNDVTIDSLSKLERSQSYAESGETSRKSKEMQELLDDLTKTLNDTKYQKNKMKQNADMISSENKKLKELLMKAETEVIELEAQVRVLEEASCERSQPATPIPTPLSPGRRAPLQSSMSNPGNICPHCNGSLFETIFEDSLVSGSPTGNNNSTDTLFTEFQNESNALQLKFNKLVQDCTCSASIPYKEVMLDTPPPFIETPPTNEPATEEPSSLKDLFEEVYLSLKKTSVVADQLMSTRKNGVLP